VVERDSAHKQLVHHAILWSKLSHVVLVPDARKDEAAADPAHLPPGAGVKTAPDEDGPEEQDTEGVRAQHSSATACGATQGSTTSGGEGASDAAGAEAAAVGMADEASASQILGRLALCCSDGRVHLYESRERDAMLSALVEGAALKGLWLPVCQEVMGEGWLVGGIGAEGDKEYEEALMERLSTPPIKGDDVSQWCLDDL